MEIWFLLLTDTFDRLDDVSVDIALMRAPETPLVRAGGELRYPPLYRVEDLIGFPVPKVDARRFKMMRSGEPLSIRSVYVEWEAVFSGWRNSQKHYYGGRDPTAKPHGPLIDVSVLNLFEEVEFEGRPFSPMT